MALSQRLHLTLDEQEIFCSLNLQDCPEMQAEKKNMAVHLSKVFEFGTENASQDLYKASQYNNIANDIQSEEPPFFSLEYLRSLFSTGSIYTTAGWFTAIRLFLVRLNRIFSAFGKAFLPALFSVGGFSYGLSFAADVGVVFTTTFYPNDKNQHLSNWERFKNVMMKDNRPYRMLNDSVWFVINLTAFILTGGTSAILNVLGFGFDVGIESIRSVFGFNKHDKLLEKLTHLINDEQQEKIKLEQDISDLKIKRFFQRHEFKKNLPQPNERPYKKRQLSINLSQLDSQIEEKQITLEIKEKNLKELDKTKDKLVKKANDFFYDRLRVMVGAVLCVIGMILILFPPSSGAGVALGIGGLAAMGITSSTGVAVLIGSLLAFIGGSLVTGLGKRLWDLGGSLVNKVSHFFNSTQENKEEVELANEIKNSHALINSMLSHTPSLSSTIPAHINYPEDLVPALPKNLSSTLIEFPALTNFNYFSLSPEDIKHPDNSNLMSTLWSFRG